jgi:hypothetical protein
MASSRLVAVPALVVAFVAGTLTTAAFTQATQSQPPLPPVVVVDYMKVPVGQEEAYLRLEREIFMPIHRDFIRRGQKRSWELYAIQFPSGTGAEYNFATINVFDSLGALDAQNYVEAARRVHPRISVDTIMRQTFGARQLVRSEVWRRLERAQ